MYLLRLKWWVALHECPLQVLSPAVFRMGLLDKMFGAAAVHLPSMLTLLLQNATMPTEGAILILKSSMIYSNPVDQTCPFKSENKLLRYSHQWLFTGALC